MNEVVSHAPGTRAMTRCRTVLVTIAMALVFLVVATSPAKAPVGVPDPNNCTVYDVVTGGVPWIVIVRDTDNQVMEGALVELQFAPAIPYGTNLGVWDLSIPPATHDCASQSIMVPTDPLGIAAFVPLFGGYVNEPRVEVYANGVFLGYVKARSTDINGDGWCNLLDLNYLRVYFFFYPEAEEADFNWSGSVELGDLSLFRYSFFSTNQSVLCP